MRRNALTQEQTKAALATLRAKGVKQREIAEELNVTPVTVSNWATGKTHGPEALLKMAEEWSK